MSSSASPLSSASFGVGARATSSHASASSRSPILRAQPLLLPQHTAQSNTAGWNVSSSTPVTPTASMPLGTASTPASPSARALGIRDRLGALPAPLHLPAQPTQPTQPSSTRRASTGATSSSSPTVHLAQISPSQAQEEKDSARRRSVGAVGSTLTRARTSLPSSIPAPVDAVTAAAATPVAPVPSSSGGLSTEDWQLDSSATACHHCQIKFSILTRKHHCRSCGLIHCDNCSKYRSSIPSKNYDDKVRVCGKCYYGLKKSKKSSSSSSGGSKTPRKGSAAAQAGNAETAETNSALSSPSASPPATALVGSGGDLAGSMTSPASSVQISELHAQLSALHQLHSSYQPEHAMLTALLANAAQLEQTYVASIQCLYAVVQQQAAQHGAEIRQRDAALAQQQRHIERLEEALHSTHSFNPAPVTHQSYGSQSGLGMPHFPRAQSHGDEASSPTLSAYRASPQMHAYHQQQQSAQQHAYGSSARGGMSRPQSASSGSAALSFSSLPLGGSASASFSDGMRAPSHSHAQAFLSHSRAISHAQQQPMLDAASEEAYLEMDEPESSHMDGRAAAALSPSYASWRQGSALDSASSGVLQDTVASPRHPLPRALSATLSPSGSLQVEEPPSPPASESRSSRSSDHRALSAASSMQRSIRDSSPAD